MSKYIVTRRKFLKSTGLAVTGGLLWGCQTEQEEKLLKFGLVTDTHYADREPGGTRFYRQSDGKLQEAVELMNQEKVDFMIHLGDFKDQDPEPVEAKTIEYTRHLEEVFSQFAGPRYHVIGNHDVDSISKQQFQEIVENTNIDQTKTYYSFDHGNFHFVVLDANFRPDGIAYDKGNFKWDEALINEAQLTWLQQDLNNTKKPTIVFCHQLLDAEVSSAHVVKNATEVQQVLKDSGKVLAVFQGHIHDEVHHVTDGIHYYTLHAMVEMDGPENNSYAIANLDQAGNIELVGYRRAGSMQFGVS